MSVILALRNAPGQPTDAAPPVTLDRGEVVVGRGAGSHLLLSGQAVSRRHCTISGEGENWRVVDSSSGGTFVNGQRITGPQFLRHGDVIRVGDREIEVMLGSAERTGSVSAPSAAWDGWGRPATATQVPTSRTAAASPAGGQDVAGLLLQAVGLQRAQVGASDHQVTAVVGAILLAALDGLARLEQDRCKAREELGVVSGRTEGIGAVCSGQELLLRLLSVAPGDGAAQVEELCVRIDAHQRALLGAMQVSLHHALDQFSPAAIKTNARGDADAWKVYERAFDAKEDGFVEVFAQTFSKKYGEAVK